MTHKSFCSLKFSGNMDFFSSMESNKIFPKSRLKLELNPSVPEGVFVSLDKVVDFKKWMDGRGNA